MRITAAPESATADPEAAETWWKAERKRFEGATRWQLGLDLAQAPLGDAFAALPLALRRDVWLRERALGGEEVPDLELEATAARQRATLRAAAVPRARPRRSA